MSRAPQRMIAQTVGRGGSICVSASGLANLIGTSASPHARLWQHPDRRHTGTSGEHASRIQFKPQTKVADRDMCAIVAINTHHVGTAIQTP